MGTVTPGDPKSEIVFMKSGRNIKTASLHLRKKKTKKIACTVSPERAKNPKWAKVQHFPGLP
jgi:hypothetical protein